MDEFGHVQIDILKIDIEGAEYDVLSQWDLSMQNLPMQIAIEIHYLGIYWGTKAYMNENDETHLLWPPHEPSLSELALFLMHLANLGYGIVSREDNPSCMHCTELTLLKLI